MAAPVIQAGPAQAQRRVPDGRQSFGIDQKMLRLYAQEIRSVQDLGVQVGIVIGGGQHPPGRLHRGERHRQGDRRPYGHAGHAHQLPGAAEHPRTPRDDHPAHVRHPHGRRRGAVHPAARRAAPRQGPGRDLRGGHGQPVLHHRHRRGAARSRDRGGRDPQRDPRGRRL